MGAGIAQVGVVNDTGCSRQQLSTSQLTERLQSDSKSAEQGVARGYQQVYNG